MKRRPRAKATTRQLISQSGQRVTSQRALLLELLRQRQGHLDADELYRMAKKKQPRLSLATVYRALRLFKGLGLVEELHFAEEHHHYEQRPQREHYHLVCLGCGCIEEFESPRITQLKEEMAREKDFEISGADIHLTGYCASCQKNRAATEAST